MPAVYFSNPVHAFGKSVPMVNLADITGDPNVFEAKLLHDLVSPFTCSDFKKSWPNFVQDASSRVYYVEDRRVELYDNTDGSYTQKKRLLDGRCPQSPRTFLNEDTCVPRADCSPPVYSGNFVLDATNLRKFYTIDGKYVYRIQDLPLVETPSPCDTNTNRFVRKNAGQDGAGCANPNTNFPSIASAIQTALSGRSIAEQKSARVVDIEETSLNCNDPNDAALGASFNVRLSDNSLTCWTHSYYREWSCFVMNDWVSNHPGNSHLHF